MWNKLSYRSKTFVFLGGACLILIVGYFSSFKKTIELYEKNQELKNIGETVSYEDFSLIQRRYKALDSTFQRIGDLDYDKLLINDVTRLINQHQVKVKGLENDLVGARQVDILTLSGSYVGLLKVLYHMEQFFYVGRIFSSRFYLKRNNKTKITSLYLDIYIQRLKDYEK